MTSAVGAVNQSLHAIADFYEQTLGSLNQQHRGMNCFVAPPTIRSGDLPYELVIYHNYELVIYQIKLVIYIHIRLVIYHIKLVVYHIKLVIYIHIKLVIYYIQMVIYTHIKLLQSGFSEACFESKSSESRFYAFRYLCIDPAASDQRQAGCVFFFFKRHESKVGMDMIFVDCSAMFIYKCTHHIVCVYIYIW